MGLVQEALASGDSDQDYYKPVSSELSGGCEIRLAALVMHTGCKESVSNVRYLKAEREGFLDLLLANPSGPSPVPGLLIAET